MSKTWSLQQISIFEWFRTGAGNLVVRARAGTGKSTTILEAINHAPEGKILLAAFNKRIARELQERLGGWGGRAEAKTLNGLGFSFVKYAWGKHITPDDAVESERVLQACGGDARGCGLDAIRVLLCFENPVSKASGCLHKASRVYRTGSEQAVIERTLERARECYAEANRRHRENQARRATICHGGSDGAKCTCRPGSPVYIWCPTHGRKS